MQYPQPLLFLARFETVYLKPAGRIQKMSKRLVLLAIVLIAGLTFSDASAAQTAPANPVGQANQEKWNNVPLRKSAYAGKKSDPAPRRDLSGIWDAATSAGVGL